MKEIINFQMQNITLSLEKIRLQMNNVFVTPDLLISSGFDLINKGIQLLNIYLQSLSCEINMKFNFKWQVQSIGLELQNTTTLLQKYEFNQNIQNQNFNFGMNMIMNQNMKQNIPQEEKKSMIFETNLGSIITIILPISFTVGKAIEHFFERYPIFNTKRNKIFFLYRSIIIKESDKTKKIEDFFVESNPKILAYDSQNAIGG